MLVLSRRQNQRIRIGDDIEVVVVETRAKNVRLGIIAPLDVEIVRDDAKNKEPRNRKAEPDE